MGDYKTRLLKRPQKFENLTDPKETKRLIEYLESLVDRLNKNMEVYTPNIPTGLTTSAITNGVVVSWDDLDNDYRRHIDGARLWRADQAEDPETAFAYNSNKTILVKCLRTTKYTDMDVAAGTYLYWVQWLNLDGLPGPVAGASTVTVS